MADLSQAEMDAAKQSILNMAAQGAAALAAAAGQAGQAPAVKVEFPTSAKIAAGILTASIVALVISNLRSKR